jgi:uncharacterized membrane protein
MPRMARTTAVDDGDPQAYEVDESELDEELEAELGEVDARSSRRPRHMGTWIEMMISSILSLVASLVLSIVAIRLAADPDASFSCDITETISCTKVALTWQAELLGFPNAYLGLIFEPMVITIAVAALGRVRFPRWYMLTAQAVYTIAIGFAYWLFLQAYFVIGALCPWCLLVTVTTTLVFMSMTRINLLDGNIRLPARAHERVTYWLRLGADTWLAVLLIAVIAAMVIVRYL